MAFTANSSDALGAAAALDAEGQSHGFAIRLPTAQLADLIQINCLNRVRGAFRVCSGWCTPTLTAWWAWTQW
jgi:hypothetical protein